jgi:hypothetical protein
MQVTDAFPYRLSFGCMTFNAKLAAGLRILAATGMRRFSYAPPLHRLLWKFGVPIRPPHFASFVSILLFESVSGGVFWGLCMWWVIWAKDGTSPVAALVFAAFFGISTGLIAAFSITHRARLHNLPDWSDIPADA